MTALQLHPTIIWHGKIVIFQMLFTTGKLVYKMDVLQRTIQRSSTLSCNTEGYEWPIRPVWHKIPTPWAWHGHNNLQQ